MRDRCKQLQQQLTKALLEKQAVELEMRFTRAQAAGGFGGRFSGSFHDGFSGQGSPEWAMPNAYGDAERYELEPEL